MRKKQTYLITAVTLSTCLLGAIYLSSTDESNNASTAKQITPKLDNTIEHKELATQPSAMPLKDNTSTNHFATKTMEESTLPAENKEDFLGISRRSEVAEKVLTDAGVIPADLDKAEFIEFDLNALKALKAGESFDLEIPQTNEIFTAEVTNVEVFDNGDKHIIGNIIGLDDSLHNTIITVGKDALYGQFTTVSGNWVFESKDQYGWIAAKRDLYRSHVEFEAVESAASNTTTTGSKDIFAPKKL
ncbi:hypothetical protein KO495_03805 [Colwellia sp. D2M02]|uniref:Uncharacterized protein n=1 Tax=Colwellia asteriadis TaxID=517723 RepID=A0ABN1L8I9_9GAMM|nr:hypothetical protein [Colwellia sp. D2M02]MBU2892448.1 hypothetical protein [Colwellia sp. D2M02]